MSELDFRPIKGRLAEFAPHRPYRQPSFQKESSSGLVLAMRAAIRKLEAEAATTNQAANLVGLSLLKGNYDLAARILEREIGTSPEDADLLTNVAAVHLEHSSVVNHVQALSAAQQAVSISPQNRAAQFNRALALEYLHFNTEAIVAWTAYINLEQDPGWIAEAREHSQRLQALPEIREGQGMESGGVTLGYIYEKANEEYAELTLLGNWAVSILREDQSSADRHLGAAKVLGKDLIRRDADSTVADLVSIIEESGENRVTVAQAFSMYLEARRAYSGFDIKISRGLLHRTLLLLPSSNKPLEMLISAAIAACDYQESSYDSAIRRLDRLLVSPVILRYPLLRERCLWLRGLIAMIQADPSLALQLYSRALDSSESRDDVGRIALFHFLLSEVFQALGHVEKTWNHLEVSLSKDQSALELRQRQAILESAATAAMSLGEPVAAMWFQSKAIRVARRASRPVLLAGALAARARMRLAAKLWDKAREDLEEARRLSLGIGDSDIRRTILAGLSLAEAEILTESEPNRALSSLTSALEAYNADGYDLVRLKLYLQRSKILLLNGVPSAAKQDVLNGISEIARRRLRRDSELSASDLVQAAELYTILFKVALELGASAEDLFDIAESAKAMVRSDLFPSGVVGKGNPEADARSLSFKEVQDRLPEGVVLVQYFQLESKLFIWAADRRRLALRSFTVDLLRLERCVDATIHGMAISAKYEDLVPCLKTLYSHLIAPIADAVAPGEVMVFVPEGFLARVPFAALVGAKRNFLLNDHPVVIVPSATLFVQAVERSRYLALSNSGQAAILAIGNPATELRDLPLAVEEVEAISRLYQGRSVQTGREATKQKFLRKFSDYPVVHLAGHAIGNPSYPFLSAFLFSAPTVSSSRNLYAYEIFNLKSAQPRLVFLSGCEGATDRSLPAVAIMGMVRPFLGIGVPGVIASLAQVEDEASKRFAIEFHSRYARGDGAWASLRGAQLSFSTRNGRDWTWALFEFFGADSSLTISKSEGSQ